jgi:hypothetical protein
MKSSVLALFLISLQLQPILAAVACLGAGQSSEAHCPMSEDAPAAGLFVGKPGAPATHGCFLAQLCAPGAPAVPKPAESFRVAIQVNPVPAIFARSLHAGLPAAPPFHPPRA